MTIEEIIDRIYAGRSQIAKLGGHTRSDNLEIVMSVDAHMTVMVGRIDNPRAASVIELDPDAPNGVRILGLPVRRDPTFADDEIRFRSEVSL